MQPSNVGLRPQQPMPASAAAQPVRLSNEQFGAVIKNLAEWVAFGPSLEANIAAHGAIVSALQQDRAAKAITVVYTGSADEAQDLIAMMLQEHQITITVDNAPPAYADNAPPAYADNAPPAYADNAPPAYAPPANAEPELPPAGLQNALEMSARPLPGGMAQIPDHGELAWRQNPVLPPRAAPQAIAEIAARAAIAAIAEEIPPPPPDVPPAAEAPRIAQVSPHESREALAQSLVNALATNDVNQLNVVMDAVQRAWRAVPHLQDFINQVISPAGKEVSRMAVSSGTLKQLVLRIANWPELKAGHKGAFLSAITGDGRVAQLMLPVHPDLTGAILLGILESDAQPREQAGFLNQVGVKPADAVKRINKLRGADARPMAALLDSEARRLSNELSLLDSPTVALKGLKGVVKLREGTKLKAERRLQRGVMLCSSNHIIVELPFHGQQGSLRDAHGRWLYAIPVANLKTPDLF